MFGSSMANKIRIVNTFYAPVKIVLMLYVLGVIIAIQIALGQYFFKLAVDKVGVSFKLAMSPYLWVGLVAYAIGTAVDLYLLSRYQFSTVQALTIPLILILAFTTGVIFFHDKPSALNLVGLGVLIVGILLATKK